MVCFAVIASGYLYFEGLPGAHKSVDVQYGTQSFEDIDNALSRDNAQGEDYK
jgi:hypothetical protein